VYYLSTHVYTVFIILTALGDNGDCNKARYGCCPDGSTAALGYNSEGCKENTDCKVGGEMHFGNLFYKNLNCPYFKPLLLYSISV